MRFELREIKDMLKRNDFNEHKFIEIVSSIELLPILPMRYLKGNKVLRCRPNDVDYFSSVNDLTYPPEQFAKLNRLSKKGQPMFYCSGFSTSSSKSNCYPRVINVLETCESFRKGEEDGEMDITVGNWSVKHDLKLFVLPLASYERDFYEMAEIKHQFNILKPSLDRRSYEFAKYMGYLLSIERKSCLYEITSSFADYMLYVNAKTKQFDGIMYPSVQASGEGFNICLKPEVADRKLKCIGARKEHLVKSGKTCTLIVSLR